MLLQGVYHGLKEDQGELKVPRRMHEMAEDYRQEVRRQRSVQAWGAQQTGCSAGGEEACTRQRPVLDPLAPPLPGVPRRWRRPAACPGSWEASALRRCESRARTRAAWRCPISCTAAPSTRSTPAVSLASAGKAAGLQRTRALAVVNARAARICLRRSPSCPHPSTGCPTLAAHLCHKRRCAGQAAGAGAGSGGARAGLHGGAGGVLHMCCCSACLQRSVAGRRQAGRRQAGRRQAGRPTLPAPHPALTLPGACLPVPRRCWAS